MYSIGCTSLGDVFTGSGLKELDGIVLPAEDLARTTVEHPLSRQQGFPEKLPSIVSEVTSAQLPQHFTHDLFYGAFFVLCCRHMPCL